MTQCLIEVNHFGHFLLTNLLLDKLKESKGRIVNVSSKSHYGQIFPFDDVNGEISFSSMTRYR